MDISTLVDDIYKVITDKGGWGEKSHSRYIDLASKTMLTRLTDIGQESDYDPTALRLSSVGQPCPRKLWYSVNKNEEGEELRGSTYLKFLYGDMLEDLLISLAIASGHKVTGEQDILYANGVKGHRDCVIDGMLIDVKSASTYSFDKFKMNGLRGYYKNLKSGRVWVPPEEADAFGYISQLSSYLYASQDDPLVTEKNKAGFLVIDKTTGNLTLDIYDLSKEVANKEKEIEDRKGMVELPNPPDRPFKDVQDGKSGNRKLTIPCTYCGFKDICHPGLRTFIYGNGPRFLTKVSRTPDVMEITG